MINNVGLLGRINVLFEWIMNLVYVNILWIVFTILGLGIFGIMPATAAMFHVTRKWVMGERDFQIFPLFWEKYKCEFVQIQALGLIFGTVGFLLLFNYHFFSEQNIIFGKFSMLGLMLLYSVSILFLFPIYVHFDMKLLSYIKSTFIIGISHILQGLVIVSGCAFIFIVCSFFSATFFFLFGSLSALWTTYIAYNWGFLRDRGIGPSSHITG